ncbi:S1C family serine protease [Fulvivirga lutea]|uniref:Trypsin-like peptidase domain-containing protein n=1 Tax=Fulvivirga lutea TaxID=2810512 RepID=A0A975A132_9BACT|nr:trypsin-like peptidase domain-containing protein [Fulvivirga lutea]QSE97451.1 trypsin-like peptidase domain-containing protein [Fulvivirga lutea]
MRKTLSIVAISFLAGLGGAYTFHKLTQNNLQEVKANEADSLNKFVHNSFEESPKAASSLRSALPTDLNDDFITASKLSTSSVVYIKNISEYTYSRSYLDWFFDREPSKTQQVSSGSGVIFSKDGYIVSNNHVVNGADRLEVVFNKKVYDAKLVGTDPSTDLAVLKIEGKNLPNIQIGTAKSLQVGEWVIAVGNPFNLTSTVTAGIVSAKGREINILEGKFPIESFIQTDAAINPGNSGGALVNKRGELVGINTAILTRTGTYNGYGFAVPVDIVKKIVGDIIEYGEVQKAFFGGEVRDFDSSVAKRLDIDIDSDIIEGVLLTYVQEDGSSFKAGLKEGDIIVKFDERSINSKSEFEEELSYHSPGDKINLTYKRKGEIKTASLVLTNREGTTSILKREIFTSESLGANFETVPKVERDLLGIEYGVKVFNIQNGLVKRIGITEDFIITDINRNAIKDPERLVNILEKIRGRVIIEGVNSKGRSGYYSFYLR